MEKIRSNMHVLVYRNFYDHCNTILTVFYLVSKAAKALINVIKSRAGEVDAPDNLCPVRLLVYMDESQEMTMARQMLPNDGRNAYQTLCSSLNELLELDLLCVFIDDF